MTHDMDAEDRMNEALDQAKAGDGGGAEEFDPAAELDRLSAENAALKEQALRYAAEAENTKRRAERENNDARAFAIQRFARDLLDAADNLNRALSASPKETGDAAVNNFVMGIEMTEKALQSAFERNGLKRIDPAKGERFDPNFHQAMMEQPAEGVPPGSVIMVMQAGYELFGRIIRPALVAVTPKGPAPAAAPAGGYDTAQDTAGAGLDTKA
jgi:molecular chaperone GrpE